jgi:hypothetical protein
MSDILLPPRNQFLREDAIRGGMDLLFFANTRHLKHADEKLASLGLGRAHHRVLYFVKRKLDVAVADLLSVLAVTKQSLGRVSKDLQARGPDRDANRGPRPAPAAHPAHTRRC